MTRQIIETNGNGGGNGHGAEIFADEASRIAAETLFPKVGQWHEPVLIDLTEIRTFLEIIHAHAAKLAALLPDDMHPGFLQLSRISPIDGNTVPTRYRIGDVENMVRDAIASADAGHNVYIEGRTVSHDVYGKCRGDDAAT